MTSRQEWAAASTVCLICFALGRYTTPVKTKTVTQVVTQENKTLDVEATAAQDRHREIVKVSVKKPDGTVSITTTTTEDDQARRAVDQKSTDNLAQTSTETKEVTRGSSPVTLSTLGGISFTGLTPVWGASVSRPLLGPIAVGIWGLSSKEAGVSVGLQF